MCSATVTSALALPKVAILHGGSTSVPVASGGSTDSDGFSLAPIQDLQIGAAPGSGWPVAVIRTHLAYNQYSHGD